MALAALAAGLALSASSAVTEAANPLEIAVQFGYNGTIKLGAWMPVSVDLTNHGQQLDGTLEIVVASGVSKGGPPTGSAIYQTPVTLAPGATKHFRTYVSEEVQAALDVRVLQGGHIVQTANVGVPSLVSGLLVGVLSDDSGALDGIATVHPGGSAPTVVHIKAADLPDSGLVLHAFDLVAVDNFSTDTLTSGQRNALVDYVMQGGSLLISTGGSWHKTLAGLADQIVPMQVTGSTVLPVSTALGGVPGVEVATGTLATGATAWISEGGRPLLIEAPAGAGMVSMATFDWGQGPIASSSDANQLLRQVVVRSTYGSSSGSSSVSMTGFKGGVPFSVSSRGGALTQALGNVPALELPAWWLIGGLVLVYILLVGPINYFVLRAAGRRALAWITVPAIALVASGGAYGASILTKGTSVVVNEISIVHVQPGWDRAYDEAFTGIVAPTRGDYEVGLGNHQRLISPLDYYNNFGDPSQGTMRVNTATGSITLPSMTAFTLRGFATEDIGAAPPVIETVQLAGGQLKGTIRNVSSVTITDGVAISGSAYQTFGRLEPGGTATFSLQPQVSSSFGNPIFMQIYPSAMCCGGPPNSNSDVERRNQMRSSILSTLLMNGFGNFTTSASPTIVLWTNQPFEQVTVNGAQPRAYVESALVLSSGVAQIGTGTLPAGLVSGRIVDLDAQLMPAGPPGMQIANSGSITYSFLPHLAPGAHLGSVVITSTNPYGQKFAGGPNASAAKGQAWDWTAGAWIDVSYVENGPTTVPYSAVNPATGEVRLKLSSEGQFSTGYLTIAGTVS